SEGRERRAVTLGLAKRLAVRACLVALLLALPGQTAFAFAVAESMLTISNLTITPALGSASILGPFDASATSHAFNSLGEEVFDGNSGTGTDVSANAAVTFAQGSAEARASTGTITAVGSVNAPGGTGLAGVNVPGSDADLTGTFAIIGASSNPVDVTFSMQVSGLLQGGSDASGFLQVDDITAQLNIDGAPVLFDFRSLPGLPSIAGINNYPDTIIPVSETLTATISLDPTVSHFLDMHSDAETQPSNPVAEPGSL